MLVTTFHATPSDELAIHISLLIPDLSDSHATQKVPVLSCINDGRLSEDEFVSTGVATDHTTPSLELEIYMSPLPVRDEAHANHSFPPESLVIDGKLSGDELLVTQIGVDQLIPSTDLEREIHILSRNLSLPRDPVSSISILQ